MPPRFTEFAHGSGAIKGTQALVGTHINGGGTPGFFQSSHYDLALPVRRASRLRRHSIVDAFVGFFITVLRSDGGAARSGSDIAKGLNQLQ